MDGELPDDPDGRLTVSGFDRLELSTETLRELTPRELSGVAGGGPNGPQPTPPVYAITGTIVCPSGATWFADCGSLQTCA